MKIRAKINYAKHQHFTFFGSLYLTSLKLCS